MDKRVPANERRHKTSTPSIRPSDSRRRLHDEYLTQSIEMEPTEYRNGVADTRPISAAGHATNVGSNAEGKPFRAPARKCPPSGRNLHLEEMKESFADELAVVGAHLAAWEVT